MRSSAITSCLAGLGRELRTPDDDACPVTARRAPEKKKRERHAHLLLLSGVVATALAACGGGGGSPAVPDACAYVDLNTSGSGTLPGNASSYSIVSAPSKGSLTLTDPLAGKFTYTPNADARGTDQFTFQAHDQSGSSNAATYRLVFTPRIMPLGDSITWGGQGGEPCPLNHVGYRKPLYDSLRSGGYVFHFVGTLASGQTAGLSDPDHEGHGAWSADELVTGRSASSCTGGGRLHQWLDEVRPDVALLHAGTNDLNFGGSGSGDPVEEAQDIRHILDAVNGWERDNWPVTVLVARIITNHRRGMAATTLFNDTVLREVVEPAISSGDEVLWVDHQSALDDIDRDYLDDLHPSPTGYQRMANVWLEALTGILPKCP